MVAEFPLILASPFVPLMSDIGSEKSQNGLASLSFISGGDKKKLFSLLYFISFVCDALDGWFAQKFNQVLTLGVVLDMVTDRISTACLLVILSQLGLVFLSLLALDIASRWLQMYSTFLVGKVSHKDVNNSTNRLFKVYSGNRMFMGYCCVACENSKEETTKEETIPKP
ncbi:hypothetical protein RJ639_014765 [Escallonia herrerae]|uniref:CDP-diacylglycerol--inositol 3-phosphatidyltransferase n=1 Tax=Escallonia herrerae TaxID=1293975 RepID=A0AA88VL27_9ASTE|nr:hypothetical protein RJ639_014765 [Escallonia herrerae]